MYHFEIIRLNQIMALACGLLSLIIISMIPYVTLLSSDLLII